MTCFLCECFVISLNALCCSVLHPQHVVGSFSSHHLGIRGSGGAPSPPALDARLRHPGAQQSRQNGRQHLPTREAGVSVLDAGSEDGGRDAVRQAAGSEVCTGQQTPQRQTCPGESPFKHRVEPQTAQLSVIHVIKLLLIVSIISKQRVTWLYVKLYTEEFLLFALQKTQYS